MSDSLLMTLHPTNLNQVGRLIEHYYEDGWRWLTIVQEDDTGAQVDPGVVPFPWKVERCQAVVMGDRLTVELWHNGGVSGFTYIDVSQSNTIGPARRELKEGVAAFFEVKDDVVALFTEGVRWETEQETLSQGRERVLKRYPIRYEFRQKPPEATT